MGAASHLCISTPAPRMENSTVGFLKYIVCIITIVVDDDDSDDDDDENTQDLVLVQHKYNKTSWGLRTNVTPAMRV